MSCKLIAGAAGVLLLGAAASAGLAHAQDRDRGQGGAVREAPQRAAPQRAAPQRAAPQRSAPRAERSRPQAQPKAQRAQRSQQQQQQRVERRQRDQKQSVERQKREQTQRAERQQRGQQKAVQQRQREEQKQAAPKQTDRPAGKQALTPERSGPQQVNQLQATNEQRKGVRERIFRERGVDRITKKDFRERVAVGVRIDRRHHRHLHRLTPAILAFAPIYAGYSYLVVDDDICIVDPATYYVVDVIPSTVEYAGGGSSRPQLVLSAEDMRFIYASVPKDRPVDVRIRLALGAEIPRPIDLERFPGGVIDRVPQIEGYRYIVVEAEVVIVDPNDRSVALVITE